MDGFNLYHALHDLQKPHLKWLNLQKLAGRLIRPKSQVVVSVKYFSAYANHFSGTDQVGSLIRHRSYVAALESKGVRCIMGNFAKRYHYFSGRGYKSKWRRYEEKQTDVAIGTHLINDAHLDEFDTALVVCVDTDMLPAFALMNEHFPGKSVVCMAPPHRKHHGELQRVAAYCGSIKVSQVEQSLFGAVVVQNSTVIARRPPSYRPPR